MKRDRNELDKRIAGQAAAEAVRLQQAWTSGKPEDLDAKRELRRILALAFQAAYDAGRKAS